VERWADPWPGSESALVRLQEQLGRQAGRVLAAEPFRPGATDAIGGCFVAFARGEAGPGHPGDRAWAAAVVWAPGAGGRRPPRRGDDHLRAAADGTPRRADDVLAQHVAAGRVPAAYAPGLLARREGPILGACVDGLTHRPDVLLVDATGLDHPRRAGLAVHLGAATGLATVGVTHRGLVVPGGPPVLTVRGDVHPVELDQRAVGAWLCTRTGTRPVLVHAAWATDVPTAVEVVLRASTEAARTPVPLQEARRVAREARALAGAG
jgi:deoxyribonuclease V